ncbi:putative 40S ribosomal protein S7 [Cocos nucifera]|uniref:Putative 40S ribosomal protein S7 n=1 Tax=Cocos nucifera TaxID=13894 RepID=A0A8K0IYV0_COCNU|nr:putative 40S ribosomal protein S7 [Cocos nucifera]
MENLGAVAISLVTPLPSSQDFTTVEACEQEEILKLKKVLSTWCKLSQMDVAGNRKAVVIHIPYRLRKAYRKIHVRLVRELEKKFSGKDVILIATRRILRPPKKGSAVVRPRSRTLTAVHDATLEDVVYPAEIVGKRIRYHLDGSKIIKIFLDPKERNNTEYKLETFTGVYRKLCGKDVVFEYPTIEKLEKMVEDGNHYAAQQIYKSSSARYIAVQKYSEALDILQAGALNQLKHGQVTCGAELALLLVETLVKGKLPYSEETLDLLRKIYQGFPKIPLPQNLGDDDDDDDMQKLSEALMAAKVRVESCSSFLKAAIRWSAEFGAPKNGSPQLHDMLAEYLYSESPELDMTRVSSHFVRGSDPKKFASTLVNFMGKAKLPTETYKKLLSFFIFLSSGKNDELQSLSGRSMA